jgi:hypothetical protein
MKTKIAAATMQLLRRGQGLGRASAGLFYWSDERRGAGTTPKEESAESETKVC